MKKLIDELLKEQERRQPAIVLSGPARAIASGALLGKCDS